MQIKEVVLYNEQGAQREIKFELGSVNIVTGGRESGKTALIHIIEYCLSRTECAVPGVIRRTVAWYGVHLQVGPVQMFIARKNPPAGLNTSSDIFLQVGHSVGVPAFRELRRTIDPEGLEATLTNAVGISENLHIPPASHSRDPLQATIKHTLFLIFQRQDEIANPSLLFHREKDNSFIPQAIKDTLPYFLGVTDPFRFTKLEELRRLRKEVRRIELRLRETQAIRGEALARGKALLAEAQELGIVASFEIPESQEAILGHLKVVGNWRPQEAEAPNDLGETLPLLIRERMELLEQFQNAQQQLGAANAFLSDQRQFSEGADEQRTRLESFRLFKDIEVDAHTCALCGSHLDVPNTTSAELSHAVVRVEEQLEAVSRERARIERTVSTMAEDLMGIRQRMRDKTIQIESAYAASESVRAEHELDRRRNATVGRVSLYLESFEESDLDDHLQQMREQYAGRIAELEEEVDSEAWEQRLTSALNVIGNLMSGWAAGLSHENAGSAFRFDPSNLTVVADTDSGPLPMRRMGGATNWLSCHLLFFFAFHHWLTVHDRPTPRFLVIDQPTQAYYPPEREDPTNDDRERVRQMYRWIFDRVQELGGKFQVIVTDHADIEDVWFQSAVRRRWRGGEKLIPQDWIDKF